MRELSKRKGDDSKYLVSKMFNLSKNDRELLGQTEVYSYPVEYGEMERGGTQIEPFSNQEFSDSQKVQIREKPVITPLDEFEGKMAYKTPEETLLHELGHVKAMKSQGMRSLSQLIGPEKLSFNKDLTMERLGAENFANRFSSKLTNQNKTIKELSYLIKKEKKWVDL
jgi:hypothetical protein